MSRKRRRILETAEREFLDKGYDGTSIDAIVREVGGSKSTVYSHFRDKDVLFAEALSQASHDLDFSLPHHRQEADSLPDAGAGQRLRLAVIELLSTLYRTRAIHLVRLLAGEARRFPDVGRQFWQEGPEQAVSVLAGILSGGSPAEGSAGGTEDAGGTGRPPDPEAERAARLIFSRAVGEEYLARVLGVRPLPDAREIADLAEALLHDLPRPLR